MNIPIGERELVRSSRAQKIPRRKSRGPDAMFRFAAVTPMLLAVAAAAVPWLWLSHASNNAHFSLVGFFVFLSLQLLPTSSFHLFSCNYLAEDKQIYNLCHDSIAILCHAYWCDLSHHCVVAGRLRAACCAVAWQHSIPKENENYCASIYPTLPEFPRWVGMLVVVEFTFSFLFLFFCDEAILWWADRHIQGWCRRLKLVVVEFQW